MIPLSLIGHQGLLVPPLTAQHNPSQAIDAGNFRPRPLDIDDAREAIPQDRNHLGNLPCRHLLGNKLASNALISRAALADPQGLPSLPDAPLGGPTAQDRGPESPAGR